ncbi:MAG TPA: peroxiredoxin [Chloroflexia bacterium]|nr:peroxiredoxin [Chloroflexia bacterium]
MAEPTLQVGDPAPDFVLPTDQDVPVRLADYRGQRVVLYFYPADDTPGCTLQACSFRDAYPQIAEQHAVVLGVSPDSAQSHRAFKTKYDLPFTLLVDADQAVAKAYGAWPRRLPDGQVTDGITRSQFIIDEAGRLVDIQVPVKATESLARALASLQR